MLKKSTPEKAKLKITLNTINLNRLMPTLAKHVHM